MLQNRRKNSKKLVSIIVENCLSAKTLYCGENKKKENLKRKHHVAKY